MMRASTLNNFPQNLFSGEDAPTRSFFESLARAYPRAIALHETPGNLWELGADGKHWGNVTEHCLMEAARAGVLAELLGFSQELQDALAEAAVAHDFYKKREIELTRKDIANGGSGRAGVLLNEREAAAALHAAGFSDSQISWIQSVSGDPENTAAMKKILDSETMDSNELAQLVLHYIDNYTRGAAWVTPAESGESGLENDIDRRNFSNAQNPDYQKMNEEGRKLNANHPFFDGMTRFEGAAAVNHEIEKVFSKIIAARGISVRFPEQLPELIDERIRAKIYSSAS